MHSEQREIPVACCRNNNGSAALRRLFSVHFQHLFDSCSRDAFELQCLRFSETCHDTSGQQQPDHLVDVELARYRLHVVHAICVLCDVSLERISERQSVLRARLACLLFGGCLAYLFVRWVRCSLARDGAESFLQATLTASCIRLAAYDTPEDNAHGT